MRSFTRVCWIYVTLHLLHYISEGEIALFYYTNLHLMVIFNTYKCADWRRFLIFTDITKKKKPREVPKAWMHVIPWTLIPLSVKPKRSWTFVQWVTSISSLCLRRLISSVNRPMDTRTHASFCSSLEAPVLQATPTRVARYFYHWVTSLFPFICHTFSLFPSHV